MVLWNICRTDAAAARLRPQGLPADDADTARLSPLGDYHLNVHGATRLPRPPVPGSGRCATRQTQTTTSVARPGLERTAGCGPMNKLCHARAGASASVSARRPVTARCPRSDEYAGATSRRAGATGRLSRSAADGSRVPVSVTEGEHPPNRRSGHSMHIADSVLSWSCGREEVAERRKPCYASSPLMKTRQGDGKAVPLAAAPARQFPPGCRRWLSLLASAGGCGYAE